MGELTKRYILPQPETPQQVAASCGYQCPRCVDEIQPDLTTFNRHYEEKHPTALPYIDDAFKIFKAIEQRPVFRDRGLAGEEPETTSSCRGGNRTYSLPVSVTGQRGSSPSSTGRSERNDNIFRGAENPSGGQLWTDESPSENAASPEFVRELTTRKISSGQLAREAEKIYGRVQLLEEVVKEYYNSHTDGSLSEEQCPEPICLSSALLKEYYDCLLGCLHASASPELQSFVRESEIPKRVWKNGIEPLLVLLQQKSQKGSVLEPSRTFSSIAYTMMGLLYETVPVLKNTWIECLGDLARFRMTVEEDDIRDHWKGVSRGWYTMASDKAPTTGRLYHHLAILARPDALQELCFYSKSLCVPVPFLKARESMMTLFQPLLTPSPNAVQRLDPVDAAFVRVHGVIFSGMHGDQLEPSMKQFLDLLDSRIGREHGNWLESGYYIGISLSCLLLGFGDKSNVLMRAILNRNRNHSENTDDNSKANTKPCANFKTSVEFAARTFQIVIARCRDESILPCLHTLLVFYWFMMDFDAGQQYLEDSLPWEQTALLLNDLLRTSELAPRLHTDKIPWPEGGIAHPLPEDYAMRGLIYTENYYPKKWFDNTAIEDAEKYSESASTVVKRRERILWLGYRIALKRRKLFWDKHAKQFSVRQDEASTPEPGASQSTVASGVKD